MYGRVSGTLKLVPIDERERKGWKEYRYYPLHPGFRSDLWGASLVTSLFHHRYENNQAVGLTSSKFFFFFIKYPRTSSHRLSLSLSFRSFLWYRQIITLKLYFHRWSMMLYGHNYRRGRTKSGRKREGEGRPLWRLIHQCRNCSYCIVAGDVSTWRQWWQHVVNGRAKSTMWNADESAGKEEGEERKEGRETSLTNLVGVGKSNL